MIDRLTFESQVGAEVNQTYKHEECLDEICENLQIISSVTLTKGKAQRRRKTKWKRMELLGKQEETKRKAKETQNRRIPCSELLTLSSLKDFKRCRRRS